MRIRTVHHVRVQCAMVSALALACLVCGCQRLAPPAAKQVESIAAAPAKVAVGIVRAQLLEETVSLPAAIESDETARLMPRVEAYVAEVLVDIGDEVQEGQTLVRLEAPEINHAVTQGRAVIQQMLAEGQVLQAELGAAHSQLDVVKAELTLKNSERDQLAKLVSSGAINRQRLVEADSSVQSASATLAKYKNAIKVSEAKLLKGKSEMAVAKAKLQAAESLAGYLEIKAPFTGLVVKRNVDAGNLVRPMSSSEGSKPLLTIAKVDRLQAVVHATVDVAALLKVGGAVSFVADDMPDKKFTGQLSRTSGSYDNRTRMMRAEIDFENPRDEATGRRPLRAGSYGSATIVLNSETLPVVPESALRRGVGGTSVVLVRAGTCLITAVEIAMEQDGLVGISSGLEAGDQVVVKNPGSLEAEQTLKDSQIELVTW